MSFDPNAMAELAHIKADRYQRSGGGGAHKVYTSSKAYDEARGYREMSPWQQLVYRTNVLWREASRDARLEYQEACYLWDRDSVEARCSYTKARKQWGLADDIPF